jgi:outer membrane biosynthesis protein TonB
MDVATDFEGSDVAAAIGVALIAVFGLMVMLASPQRPVVFAEISDENAREVAVSITPVPLLKLGSNAKLPSAWQRKPAPRPVVKRDESPLPSPQAKQTPEAIPTTEVADAAVAPTPTPPVDASVPTPTEPESAPTDASAPAPSATGPGDPNGSPNGTETDPLKARAVDRYRAQIAAFLKERFNIRGKIPFDELKTLHASAVVTVGSDRSVAGFSITGPSGNIVFDTEVRSALQQRVGATLPAPPPLYPDVLGTSVSVGFSCPIRSECE